MPEVTVAALVEPDAERRATACRTLADLHAYEGLGEALANEELDFACVAVPVDQLAPTAREVLRADVNVLVEKPTASSEEEAMDLIAEAANRGLALGVGHVERFNPAIVALKGKLEQVGRIYQMHARRLSPFPLRESMHGVSVDLATHDIDVMRYLTGAEVERAFAETAQRHHSRGEDLICATLRFDNDATGLLEVNWLTPTKVRELTVTGERGMFRVDYLTQDLFFYNHPVSVTEWGALAGMRGPGEGDMVRYALTRREPLRVQWEAFLQAIRDGSAPPVGGLEGLAALSTSIAIQESGQSHVPVVPGYRAAMDVLSAG